MTDVDGLFVDYNDETDEVEMIDLFDGEIVSEKSIIDNYVPGQEMTEAEAHNITSSIRAAGTALYVLIARAHDGKAYKALGYESFETYVKTEFDISRNRAYQLLDQSKIIEAIESVTPDGTEVKLTEAQARDIKRELPKITERLEEETSGKSAEESASIVDDIITDERSRIKDERASKKLSDKDAYDDSGDNGGKGAGANNGGMDSINSFDPDDFDSSEGKVNNVDNALTSMNASDNEDEAGYTGKAQSRPSVIDPKDLSKVMDFMEVIEKLPSVHNLLGSLSPAQRKVLSQKSLDASDYLNELLDELAIREMSR